MKAGKKEGSEIIEREIDEILRACVPEDADVSDESKTVVNLDEVMTGVFGAVGIPGFEDTYDAQRDAPDNVTVTYELTRAITSFT